MVEVAPIEIEATEVLGVFDFADDPVVWAHAVSPRSLHGNLGQTNQFGHLPVQRTAHADISPFAGGNERENDDGRVKAIDEGFERSGNTRIVEGTPRGESIEWTAN